MKIRKETRLPDPHRPPSGPWRQFPVRVVSNRLSSVMIDGSHRPYEENVALTRKVCRYALQPDYVSVEGELGVLAGVEDDVSAEHSHYTQPEEVETSSKRPVSTVLPFPSAPVAGGPSSNLSSAPATPVVSIPPPLRFDILEEIGDSQFPHRSPWLIVRTDAICQE